MHPSIYLSIYCIYLSICREFIMRSWGRNFGWRFLRGHNDAHGWTSCCCTTLINYTERDRSVGDIGDSRRSQFFWWILGAHVDTDLSKLWVAQMMDAWKIASQTGLGGCIVLNIYEYTWVHRRGINLNTAVLRIHAINTFRTENIHVYLGPLYIRAHLEFGPFGVEPTWTWSGP
jgi:hypothetical protein